jgi:excisionase family DNA binding protein
MPHADNTTIIAPRLLNTRQAAQYLGLAVPTLREWASMGIHLPVVRIGRRVLYDIRDLDRHIEASKRLPEGDDILRRMKGASR